MADVHDKATRSKNMRAIATRDTAIEKRLASLLTGQGLAFRVQDASLPGRPDFVVDEYRCVIFTHGCFWHHHHCYLFKVPATRTEFWLEKMASWLVEWKNATETQWLKDSPSQPLQQSLKDPERAYKNFFRLRHHAQTVCYLSRL